MKLLLRHSRKATDITVLEMLDETDNDGNSPLHLAVDSGHLPVTEYIIENCLKISK